VALAEPFNAIIEHNEQVQDDLAAGQPNVKKPACK